MQYTTLETLKNHLWIITTDEDATLTTLITKWSDMLSTELWDDLWTKTITSRYDGTWSNRIVLETVINSISLIQHTTDQGYSRTGIDLDFIDWYVVYTKQMLPKGTKNIKIIYSKWYEVVPSDLESFFLKYVSRMRQEQITNSKDKEIKMKKLDWLSITYFWPNELSTRDEQFAVDYEAIKGKYKVFSFLVI